MFEFEKFDKIPRYKSALCITEKIDGTNAQVMIQAKPQKFDEGYDNDILDYETAVNNPYCIDRWQTDDNLEYAMFAGSRKRWIAPEDTAGLEKGCDNYSFALWVQTNKEDLRSLEEGRHYGEWFGGKIARHYGRAEKSFKLFNAIRWNPNNPNRPKCCDVVDILDFKDPANAMMELKVNGSRILTDKGVPFHKPEGIIIYNTGSRSYFKQTFDFDKGKWSEAQS